jgi:hypothetical protein
MDLSAMVEEDKVHRSSGTKCAVQAADLHASLMDSETETEIEIEIQQQHGGAMGVVVAASIQSDGVLATRLRERGVSPATAEALARLAPGLVARQLEVYDWLREVDPDDERHTPGRLRRMIEEDWVPPAGFVPGAERARRARAAAEAEQHAREERARREAAREAQQVVAGAERRAALARIGLVEDDQREWGRVVNSLPRLAPRPADSLRRAFFYAPHDGDPAAVILRDEADLALLHSDRCADARAAIERVVASRYQLLGVRVVFLHYDAVVAMLVTEGEGASAPV